MSAWNARIGMSANSSMSGYSIGWGMPVMHCQTCGCRVGSGLCTRHPHDPERPVQMLYDKHALISVRRYVAAKPTVIAAPSSPH